MSFRISNILDYDYFLALDIGAFKIKVLVCKIEGQELKVVSSSSLRQNKKDMLNGEITDISSISKSIQKCITKACQNLDSIPSDIIVSFNSSEMIYDFTSINYIRKGKENPITMSEIDNMIEDVEIRSIDKIKTKTENRLGIIEAEMKLITTSITGIYIDGQRISNPIGFTGKNIKFNIINVYSSVSRFLIIKNIIRDLNLKLISIVPLAICLPKLTEDSSYYLEQNIYIDLGYSKTTIILQNNSEIIGFNVLNFGLNVLEDELRKELGKSYLDIENLMMNFDENYDDNKGLIDVYLDFLFDSIIVAIQDVEKSFFAKNIFISSSLKSEILKKRLLKYFEDKHIGKGIEIIYDFVFDDELMKIGAQTGLPVLSLAKAGKELMAIKKDPLVRILKYVIYKYE